MIYGHTLVQDVARYLSDYDTTQPEYQHVEWTQTDLQTYFTLSVQSLALVMPTLFTKTIEVPITNGVIDLPSDCTHYIKSVFVRRPDGSISLSLRELPPSGSTYRMPRPVCAGNTGSTEVQLISGSTSAVQKTLSVAGAPLGTLAVLCGCTPEISSVDAGVDIPASYKPVIFWWMVSYAMGTDIESVPMRERSDAYWARGTGLLPSLQPKQKVR